VGHAARALDYRGPLSIDALVVDDGEVRLKPIGEVNARFTMGHAGHRLRRRLAGDVGFWLFIPTKTLRRAGIEPRELMRSLPGSVVPTGDPATARVVVTLLWTGARYDEVVAGWRSWLATLPNGEVLDRAMGFVRACP